MNKATSTALVAAAIVIPFGMIAGAALIIIRKTTNILDKMTGDKRTSQIGLNLIEKFEGKKLQAYVCPAGVVTIGIGHTKTAKIGQTITNEQAYELLKQDVREAENAINFENLKLTQNQFDALVSFVFNVGVGAFKRSTLLKKAKVNSNDSTIASEFDKWVLVKGVKSSGLISRRQAEKELYFKK